MLSIDKNYDRLLNDGRVLQIGSEPDQENQSDGLAWTLLECFAEVKNPWLTLKGERWQDGQARRLDYWRVEKADSLVVLPQQGDRLLLPHPIFRPGIGRSTWDFPGGRLTDITKVELTLAEILNRELDVPLDAITEIVPLNPGGWTVNSSFSSQKLYGYWIRINEDFSPNPKAIGAEFHVPSQLVDLLKILDCLQCRALLREWQQINHRFDGSD
ncbi:hypothetical protein IQE94_04960 [Synechocystis sp. PCC 7339]|uniref:hypothetical protein n=1 Tax=Synechocystis sp. PCC 7339 TaxID=2782213 RepID=UPI001CBCDF14|nr:hypothetical protein [Synechocystis sp. PCC 7339]UAJ73640.1 hypothetical protein IQE94_04960 [Synechocystis sp. PCC 7339]